MLREIDPFTCERAAYRRLKEKGLCQQGVIPDFYGVIEQIDPAAWQPHLRKFLEDKIRPNAVLIEYIPNMQELTLSNFLEERVDRLYGILKAIHQAGVFHSDAYPRNMMIQEDTGRVLWIDFDRAQTLQDDESNEKSLERHNRRITDEDEEMKEFFGLLVRTSIVRIGISRPKKMF